MQGGGSGLTLEDAEVDGGLDLLWVAAHVVGLSLDRSGRLPGLGLERGREACVREDRRVDAPGQVAEVLQGVGGVPLELKRSSSISRTFRRTSPACEATSCTSFRFAGSIGSSTGMARVIAPRGSPWWRTAIASPMGSSCPVTRTLATEGASGGCETDGTSRSPIRSHIRTSLAPVLSPTRRAIRGRTSSTE